MALCGFKNVILTEDSIRVLGVHFSYNEILLHDRNFVDVIRNIEGVLKAWRMRCLSLHGKIVTFKSLAISKIIYVSYLTSVPSDIIHTLSTIQKSFVWDGKRPKIKHNTLINSYEKGGLKDIDIGSKFKALHLSWLARYHSDNKHPWMQMLNRILFASFSLDTIFFPNLSIDVTALAKFPPFFKNIVTNWIDISQHSPNTASLILSESLWYNSKITINNKSLSPQFFCLKQLVFVNDLFDENGTFLAWADFAQKFNLERNHLFKVDSS